jgi:uncharacterized protein YjbJ (UPF0337 family)
MNEDKIKGQWKQLAGKLKTQWGTLTDDDLKIAEGNSEYLAGRLQEQVWVEGGLSYDNVHYVNADPANPLKDKPDRMSLWEIHPITKFLVCLKDHCDATSEKDWLALDAK